MSHFELGISSSDMQGEIKMSLVTYQPAIINQNSYSFTSISLDRTFSFFICKLCYQTQQFAESCSNLILVTFWFCHNLKEADWLCNAKTNWQLFGLELDKIYVWDFRLEVTNSARWTQAGTKISVFSPHSVNGPVFSCLASIQLCRSI